MVAYPIPPRAQLLLILFLQAHLCLQSSLGAAGASGLSFSYDFSIPDPARGIHRKFLTYDGAYNGGKNNTGRRVFYSQPLRLWDGRSGKQASFNTSFSFATMVGGTTTKRPPNGTSRPRGRRPARVSFFVGPWPIPSRPPWYGSGWRMGVSSDDPTSTVVDVDVNTQWDDIGYDPAADDDDDIDDVAGMRSAARGDDDDDDDYDDDDLLSAGSTVSVDVVYDAGSSVMMLRVRLADGSGGVDAILAHRNLKEQGLPQDAAVGLSVAQGTGDHFASPVVISWSFSSTDPSIPEPSIPLGVITVSCVAIALAALLVSALLFFVMRKRWAATTVNTDLKGAKEFSHQELSASTNNDFSDDRRALDDPRMPPVVVKVLTRPMEPQTTRKEKDYVTEVTSQRQQASQTAW